MPEDDIANKPINTTEKGTQVQPEEQHQVKPSTSHPTPPTSQPAPSTSSKDMSPPNVADVSICRVCGTGGDREDWLGCESCEYWVHLPCVGFEMQPRTHMGRFLQKFTYHCPAHRTNKVWCVPLSCFLWIYVQMMERSWALLNISLPKTEHQKLWNRTLTSGGEPSPGPKKGANTPFPTM